MAKSVEQLQEELGRVSEQTRRAYDLLNSKARDGRFYVGLYRQLDIAENTLKKKGVFESSKKEAEATIAELRPKIKDAEAEYKKFQDQKNALNKELKAIKATEQEKKTTAATVKSAANLYTKALDELDKADLGLEGYNGDKKYISAYTKAQEAYNTLTKSGVTPKVALPQPKIEIPVVEEKVKLDKDGNPVNDVKLNELIATVTKPENKQLLIDLQKDLRDNFGYKGPVDGSPSAAFMPALSVAYTQRGQLPAPWRGTDLRSFIANPTVEGTAGGAGGDGKPNQWGTISNPTQAKSVINNVVSSLLNREATAKEIASITKKLVAAQKANPYRQDANGMTVGGIDAQQFIEDLITKGDEFATKKQAKQDLVEAGIQATLDANGIQYKPGQLKVYSDRVKNGEDIKAIESEIRNIASLGQPDAIKKLMASGTDLETIYAPYKRTMAASLGVNPETITLDDPTLRMAIGPDKEMSLYDYKKAIRQDNRWKFSEEANDEVTNMINQVKRDFGFMG